MRARDSNPESFGLMSPLPRPIGSPACPTKRLQLINSSPRITQDCTCKTGVRHHIWYCRIYNLRLTFARQMRLVERANLAQSNRAGGRDKIAGGRKVSFTMRMFVGMRDILQREAAKRRSVLRPDVSEGEVVREIIEEWAMANGYVEDYRVSGRQEQHEPQPADLH